MSYLDTRLGETQNGYKCVKKGKAGNWASFKLDNTQEWTQEQWLEWKSCNEQWQQLQAKEDEQRQQQSLSANYRHEQYTQLLGELTLHPDDRADSDQTWVYSRAN
jgi:hypothetical protein